MKRPTAASLKKVTPENLAALGAERLADILTAVAATRPDVKRRLRMELAAEQGADHLGAEVDKRLNTLSTSRSKVSWRQRPTFVRDLDALRVLISENMARLDAEGARERMWRFMDVARPIGARVKDRDGELAAVFARAAADLGGMIAPLDLAEAALHLADAVGRYPIGWATWLPITLAEAQPQLAAAALTILSARSGGGPGWVGAIRQLADCANDIEAFRDTFSAEALRTPAFAAQVAQRFLAAGQVEAAGRMLEGARGRAAPQDWEWESASIDYLERSGFEAQAQTARWASFERTLSVERARAFIKRLDDFDDVEAETRAFAHAAKARDFGGGLAFLMDWPALGEAARMIQAREAEADVPPEQAELWAGRLVARWPGAALILLRRAAATALRRRQFALCERLSQEAESISAQAG